MKLGFNGTVLTILTSTILAFAPAARAAHATNFLNALQQEVTNRVANPGTNTALKAALTAASHILSRNTRTLSGDLTTLATAATVLNRRFSNDATFSSLEDNALDSYSAEAHAQLDNAELHRGTNSISRVLSNQLAKLHVALTNADANSNGVPAHARALAQVFNKMRTPIARVLRQFPTIPFAAPAEIATGKNITLSENAVVNDQTKFYFHTTASDTGLRYLHYTSDNPGELGTWTYEHLTSRTAVLHCTVSASEVPGGSTAPHDMSLTFTSATTGTFTGMNTLRENIEGTFTID